MITYMCSVCGFAFEEADGHPRSGIAPGTAWKDIPAAWQCPDCGASKDEFEMITV